MSCHSGKVGCINPVKQVPLAISEMHHHIRLPIQPVKTGLWGRLEGRPSRNPFHEVVSMFEHL